MFERRLNRQFRFVRIESKQVENPFLSNPGTEKRRRNIDDVHAG